MGTNHRQPNSSDFWAEVWPVICIDFDGVLNQYAGWEGSYLDYPPRDGVREFMQVLNAHYFVVVLTARPDDNLQAVDEWLYRHGLKQYVQLVTNRKPPAVCYVDDRGVCFDGNFEKAIREIAQFKPFWDNTGKADDPTKDQIERLGLDKS